MINTTTNRSLVITTKDQQKIFVINLQKEETRGEILSFIDLTGIIKTILIGSGTFGVEISSNYLSRTCSSLSKNKEDEDKNKEELNKIQAFKDKGLADTIYYLETFIKLSKKQKKDLAKLFAKI